MIKIITTGGAPIEFLIRRGRQVVISEDPIQVTEEEFALLNSRLGTQITKFVEQKAAPIAAETTTEAAAPVTTETTQPTAPAATSGTTVEG